MAHQALTSPSEFSNVRPLQEPVLNLLLPADRFETSLWQRIAQQIHERLYPEKLPPLRLTSKPVRVRSIWGDYDYKKSGATGSIILHSLAIAAIIALSVYGGQKVVEKKPVQETMIVVPPDLKDILMPVSPKKNDTIAGGGGGGDRDKLQAPKGKLPKLSMEQITPRLW